MQFVYLKESFCPSLDEKVAVLYEVAPLSPKQLQHLLLHILRIPFMSCLALFCTVHQSHMIECSSASLGRRMLIMILLLQAYGSNGQLVVNYANTPAWG